MQLKEATKSVRWKNIFLFYGIVLLGTYGVRKLPNLLQLVLAQITDIPFSFNYNHGIFIAIIAWLFYKKTKVKQEITLLGDHTLKALLFPVILLSAYTITGINNNNGIDRHSWALLFCSMALVYNIMEEYAWRGYLVEALGKLPYVIRSLVSGIFWAIWHLVVFKDFEQYGGFIMFLLFCIVFSFILTFAVQRTKSILVAAAIHAFIIQLNVTALICLAIFLVLLFTWNNKPGDKQEQPVKSAV